MFYPLVEVPLVAYIVLQCLQVVRDHRRDIVPTWFLLCVRDHANPAPTHALVPDDLCR